MVRRKMSKDSFKRTDRFSFARETFLFLTTLRVILMAELEIRELWQKNKRLLPGSLHESGGARQGCQRGDLQLLK